MKLLLMMVILVLGMSQAHALSEAPSDQDPNPIVEPTVDPLPVTPNDPELPEDCGVRS